MLPDDTKPQAVKSSINKSSWPVNPAVVPLSGPAALAHSKPTNTHELSQIWTLEITHSRPKLAGCAITQGRENATRVPKLQRLCLSSVPLTIRGHSATLSAKERTPFIFGSGSVRRWRFPATFQLHYRDLCRDYDKNTCFLQFQSDQGHFSLDFFPLRHHLSKLNATGWSAFVQTADITRCQKSSGSKLSKSTSTCVFYHLPTHHVRESISNTSWWLFEFILEVLDVFAGLIKTVKLQYCIAHGDIYVGFFF